MSQISSTATFIESLRKLPASTPICQVEIINGEAKLKSKAGFRDQYLGARNRSITPVGTGNPVDEFFDAAKKQSGQLLKKTGQLLDAQFSPAEENALSQANATVDNLLKAISRASGSNKKPSL